MIWVILTGCLLCISRTLGVSSTELSVSADRLIDIASQVVRVSVKYEITNHGKSEFNSFLHIVSEEEHSKLSYISATENQKDSKLRVVKTDVQGIKKGYVAYKVELLTSVAPGSKILSTVEYFLALYLEPYPAKIIQSESQFMLYNGNAHVPSYYPVSKETTTFVLPAGKLISHTPVAPVKTDGNKIIYGAYTDQKPFTKVDIKIHYENNSPFVIATDVERHIEISHWGNIAVEERISLLHKGAELKGPFSRLDFQLDRRGSRRPVVTQYKTLLPATAKDIYYRDEIGNISTSAVRKMTDAVEVTIQPRFPLFGGWRTNYVLGYNMPAYQYLYSSGNAFALRMRLFDHLFDNSVVEHLKVKIILPEGSKDFKLVTPYSVKRCPDELHFTYLDTTGRPVIVVEKNNLVDAHIQQFTLNYEFDRLQLWREPLLACTAFAVLFLAVIVYVRLDFTIVSDASTESRLQAQSQVEQLSDLHSERLKIYDQFADAAQKLRNNKDTAAFASARKKTDNDLKNVTKSIADLQAELKSGNVEVYEKINELQKINEATVQVISTFLAQVERLVKGQITKSAFTEAENTYKHKMKEAREKMDSIVYSL